MTLSWRDEIRQAIKDHQSLSHFLDYPVARTTYPLMIPPSLAEKIRKQGPTSALWKQFVPHADESLEGGFMDPIGDHLHQKAPQLIHRYKQRALLLPTTKCPVLCRYCFRKNELSIPDDLFKPNLKATISYLKDNPSITELILTGGDPLVLSTSKLKELLNEFLNIPQLKYLRLHTRFLTILPSRFTGDLIHFLRDLTTKFKTVSLCLHFNHPDEFDGDSLKALKDLRKTRVQLLSQSVLLKDINNCENTLNDLYDFCENEGVRPYYLHHPDQAKGTQHFQVSLSEGKKIYSRLRQLRPGWSLPFYILDDPKGTGKKLLE